MKIAFFISSLQAGGAERVMTILANELYRRGHQVVLVHQGDGQAPPAYPLDPGVQVIATGLSSASTSFFQGLKRNLTRLARLRSTFKALKPDVLLSFMDRTNVLAVLATRGLSLPVIVSERMDPRGNPLPPVWRWLRTLAYTLADGLVMQSAGARDFFPGWIRKKSVILPNPILTPSGRVNRDVFHAPLVVAMGRLDPAKGFDVLIPAFARALDTCPGWSLHILGEGPERARLKAQADRLGLGEAVQMPGRIPEPHQRLLDADLFILSSRVEGFPNALCEAMACGLPVIATECTDSIRTILEEPATGRVVAPEDAEALTQAMVELMGDPEGRKAMGDRGRQSIARFQGNAVIEDWERLLVRAHRSHPIH